MQYINLFPTPLYVDTQLDLAKELLPVAEDYITRYSSKYLGQEKYVSTYNIDSASIYQQDDLRLVKLNEYIDKVSRKYFEDNSIDSTNWTLKPYYLFNKITSGGAHPIHSHPGSILSGCFYLKVPKDTTPIVFNDPRDYWKFIQYPPIFGKSRDNYKLLPEYVINPIEGTFLMWPSWLEHQVPTSVSSEERICVAFNLQPN
jgi:uncharacterized protein (TIGR02466 family)